MAGILRFCQSGYGGLILVVLVGLLVLLFQVLALRSRTVGRKSSCEPCGRQGSCRQRYQGNEASALI